MASILNPSTPRSTQEVSAITVTESRQANEGPVAPNFTATDQLSANGASTEPAVADSKPKKKKKKSKSKKKKVTQDSDAQDEQPMDKKPKEEPFSTQMSEIADIIAKTNEGDQSAEAAGKGEDHDGKDHDTKVCDELFPNGQECIPSDGSE